MPRETAANIKKAADDRRRRRATFLAERAEARALQDRVAPRRARLARTREAIRTRTFRS